MFMSYDIPWECKTLVATDCAGMGLHVSDIDVVINVGKSSNANTILIYIIPIQIRCT